jgi:hypothetical protein
MINYIRKNQGEHRWDGYKCFKCFRDHNGELFQGGAKYVVFDDGILVGAFSSQTEADLAFCSSAPRDMTIRLSDYKGIDRRLR